MKCFSLFSGIGGFDLAMSRLGHELVGACENDEHARSIYARHFPNVKIWPDATTIKPEELPDFDILCGGFPCQPFSTSGKRFGVSDARGTLFFEIARIAEVKRPKILFLENVRGLFIDQKGRTFGTFLKILDGLGYDVEWQLINSKYFVPQDRKRIYIVGHLRDKPTPKIFPIREAIEEDNAESKKQTKVCVGGIIALYFKRPSDGSYLNTESGKRMFTPLEFERLQGFPDGWTDGISDTHRYKTVGNAVTVPVIEFLGKRLCN